MRFGLACLLGLGVPGVLMAEGDGDVDLQSDCIRSYDRVTFQITEVTDIPYPDENGGATAYVKLGWDLTNHPQEFYTTSVEPIKSNSITRDTGKVTWGDGGRFEFADVCGADRIHFQVWEQDQGPGHSDDADDMLWNYHSKTTVDYYYQMAGNTRSCWYARWNTENGQVVDGDALYSSTVIFRWCVTVDCGGHEHCTGENVGLGYSTMVSLPGTFLMLFLACYCLSGLRQRNRHRGRNGGRDWPRRNQPFPDGASGQGNNLTRGPTDVEMVPWVNRIKQLPQADHVPDPNVEAGAEEDLCAVCLSELDNKVKHLPCRHTFHAECIDMWGDQSHQCPLCKAEVPAPQS